MCSSTSRVLLQKRIASKVLDRIVERLKGISIRDQCSVPFPPNDEATMGPVVCKTQYDKIWVICHDSTVFVT